MAAKPDRAVCEELASMTGWDVADHFKCEYDGDSNAIDHGGFFYDMRDWEQHGYANIVDFLMDEEDRDNPVLIVQCGTVHRIDDPKRMESCWSCMGIEKDDPSRNEIRAQIYAVRHASGAEWEPENTKRFPMKSWPNEWRIWRSVYDWLKALGE